MQNLSSSSVPIKVLKFQPQLINSLIRGIFCLFGAGSNLLVVRYFGQNESFVLPVVVPCGPKPQLIIDAAVTNRATDKDLKFFIPNTVLILVY